MQKATIDVLLANFPYTGISGYPAQARAIEKWWEKEVHKLQADERIGRVASADFSGTPTYRVRNLAVETMKEKDFDVLVMVDSDMHPDMYVGAADWVVPFMDEAIDFHYPRLCNEEPGILCAPYVGGGMKDGRWEEKPWIFLWDHKEGHPASPGGVKLEAMPRAFAAATRGLYPTDGSGLGLVAYNKHAFELVDHPYFDYEWEDNRKIKIVSTEDIWSIRDIGIAGRIKYGKHIVWHAMSSWAGHYKVKCLGMPVCTNRDEVDEMFIRAYEDGVRKGDEVRWKGEAIADPLDIPTRTRGSIVPTLPGRFTLPNEVPGNGKPKWERGRRDVFGNELECLGMPFTSDTDLQVLWDIVREQNTTSFEKRELKIADVGSWVGDSAVAMACAGGPQVQVFCIDHWEGNEHDFAGDIAKQFGYKEVYETFKRNTAAFGDRIVPVLGDTVDSVEQEFEREEFDVVFIDAEHTEEAVQADIKAWWPKVRVGGVLCGHDYSDGFPGVIAAVTREFGPAVKTHENSSVWRVDKLAPRESDRLIGRHRYLPGPDPVSEVTTDLIQKIVTKTCEDAGELAFIRLANPYPGDGQLALAMLAGCEDSSTVLDHSPSILCTSPGEMTTELDKNTSGLLDYIQIATETDPLEEAITAEPEEFDAVVIGWIPLGQQEQSDEITAAWLSHVKPGGLLISMTPFTGSTTVEGTGIHYIQQPKLQEVANDK